MQPQFHRLDSPERMICRDNFMSQCSDEPLSVDNQQQTSLKLVYSFRTEGRVVPAPAPGGWAVDAPHQQCWCPVLGTVVSLLLSLFVGTGNLSVNCLSLSSGFAQLLLQQNTAPIPDTSMVWRYKQNLDSQQSSPGFIFLLQEELWTTFCTAVNQRMQF